MSEPKTRKITTIVAGGDMWEPTHEELQTLVEQFMHADMDPNGSVVATTTSKPVKVRVIDVTASEGILASTGWLSDKDIELCCEAAARAQHGLPAGSEERTRAGILAFRARLDLRMNED